jgi:CHAT domain-containing protein
MKDAKRLYAKGEFDQASLVYLRARESFAELGDECEALFANGWVGYCYLRIPKTQQSVEIFERLFQEFQRRSYRSLFAQTLPALADAESSLGEFSKTLDYAARGLKVSEEIEDTVLGVRCLGQAISIHLSLGDYRRSLESLIQAVRLADTLPPDPTLTWQLYVQAAFDFHFLGFKSSALAFEQEALRLATASAVPLLRSRTWEQLGVIYGEQKNYEEAIKSGERALAEGQNIADEMSRNNVVAHSLVALGKLRLAAGHLRTAIEDFDQSISLYEKLKFHVYFYEAHKGKLRALIALHDDRGADAELKTVLTLFEQNRGKITEERNSDIFFDAGQDTYDIAAGFAYSRLNDQNRAFEYAEASRARSLSEMMNRGARVKDGREMPDIGLASQTDNLTLAQIQTRMPEQTQILEYSLLEDKLIAWVIKRQKITSAVVALDQNEFDQKIQHYRALVARGAKDDDEARRTAAKELYSSLISPVETLLDHDLQLFIVADKGLHYVPFATLVSPSSGKFLIEDYSIQMAPSASVLVWCSEHAKNRAGIFDERLLSIGNPNFDQNAFPGLPTLPAAGREAKAIGSFYQFRTVLVGGEALAGRVWDDLKSADVIHFATHSVADTRSPLLTKLLLASNQANGVSTHHATNGFLQASEIYGLKLPRTRLVVLSACQTGIERAYRGEGAIGLARPFLIAGVPIVVASLWPVDSESTADLMIKFHEYRTQARKPTVEALRQVQLDMIHNQQLGSQGTYGWAAFVAIGGYAAF